MRNKGIPFQGIMSWTKSRGNNNKIQKGHETEMSKCKNVVRQKFRKTKMISTRKLVLLTRVLLLIDPWS